ncbi:putative transcription factor C2C2-CO-like family [Helianthus annuus]|uniref:Putative B-box type zinc finger protein with CCT domain-containing protein n=1 Tax=Helianthus annuus TaxID=4232 RepID=A0A251RQM5_HELAN|nr:zinc finger protein CONSTANS-LIKE 16 [Helianthus annuus]KAF5755520.1 putative transcription factor C2C2-CO-like family [Helianthus annuus]KAJ0813250.1 putative transcription factor C2C2-CO-like family [Helianthus annuus]KAJ0817218.1 putative transcription factor C2C2-CO-like family [Helianthus annuus]
MVSSHKNLANVIGGKTARACDNCIRKRARWYCAADDAFLCQSCDGSVHSANPLARRHERVRLKVASLKLSSLDKPAPLPWPQGFTKKPRTPRGGNRHASRQTPKSEESSMSFNFNPLHLVPEIGSDEMTTVTSEEQLLYQVPVFDPFETELCLSGNSNSNETAIPVKQTEVTTDPVDVDHHHHENKVMVDLNSLNGLILPSDVELAEFAADVESLLGKGLDEESFAMEGLGLLDCREKESMERVKVEEEDDHMQCDILESEIEMMREPFQLSFDYDSPLWDEKVVVEGGDCMHMGVVKVDEEEDDHVNNVHIVQKDDDENKKNKRILKLDNYEGIIAAWDEQRSPWTTGDRPELDWPECLDGIMHHHHPYGDMGMMTGNPAMLDGGREARVSRYREKRRTRLFSKKIRYEVRKLNAEKRPRMKGRFVKRASSSGFPLLSK